MWGAVSHACRWRIQLCIILALQGRPLTPTSLPFQIKKVNQYPSNRKDEGLGRHWEIDPHPWVFETWLQSWKETPPFHCTVLSYATTSREMHQHPSWDWHRGITPPPHAALSSCLACIILFWKIVKHNGKLCPVCLLVETPTHSLDQEKSGFLWDD